MWRRYGTHDVTLDGGIDDLGNHVFVGEAHHKPVLGRVVLVLVLWEPVSVQRSKERTETVGSGRYYYCNHRHHTAMATVMLLYKPLSLAIPSSVMPSTWALILTWEISLLRAR